MDRVYERLTSAWFKAMFKLSNSWHTGLAPSRLLGDGIYRFHSMNDIVVHARIDTSLLTKTDLLCWYRSRRSRNPHLQVWRAVWTC